MQWIRFTTRVEGDTVVLPGLRALAGKTVEVRVRVQPESRLDRMTDWQFHVDLEVEEAADPTPVPTIEEVRAMLAHDTGSWAAEIIAEREERG